MSLKKFKPTSPGQRHKLVSDYSEVTASKPEKSLTKGSGKSGGRNNSGKMTMRYIGGGHKRKYRVIDFKRNKHEIPAKVHSIEYDPNRTARIALLFYADGEKRYIVAPEGLQVGQTVSSGNKATPEVGNALYLKDIPLGVIKNLEILATSVRFLSAWVTAPPLIRPPVTVSMIGGASPVRLNKGPFIKGVSSGEGQSMGFAPLRSKFPPAKFDFKSFNPIN